MIYDNNVTTKQDLYVCVNNKANKSNVKIENTVFNDHCYLTTMEEAKLAIKEESVKEEFEMEEGELKSELDPTTIIKAIKVPNTNYFIVPPEFTQLSKLKHTVIIQESTKSIKQEPNKPDANKLSFKNEEEYDTKHDEKEQILIIGDDEKYDESNDEMEEEKHMIDDEKYYESNEMEEEKQMIDDEKYDELHDEMEEEKHMIDDEKNHESNDEMEATYDYTLNEVDELDEVTVTDDEQQYIQVEAFIKESLQAKLLALFKANDEIKTADGTLIDKNMIMDSFNGLLDINTMKNMWTAINGKNLNSDLIKILETVQNKYKKDLECKTVFDVEYLDTDEKIFAEFERRKTYFCYLYAAYQCEICYKGFKREKNLDTHFLKAHDVSVGDITCPVCSVRYKKNCDLTKHLSVAHRAVYKCKLCPLVTYYRYTMINHYEQHQGKQYDCEICGLTYKSKSTLNSHITSRHRPSELLRTCLSCGRDFTSEIGLKLHRSKEHPTESSTTNNYICHSCSMVFPTEVAYLEHSMEKHDGRLDDGIELKKFKHRKRKVDNVLKEKRLMKTPQKCRVCNITGTKNGWLNRHFITDHPTLDIHEVYADTKEHLCHICPKSFKLPCMLRDHLNTHSGLRPYPCTYCPKSFHSRAALTCHRQWHFPPTHECQICKKKFHTGTNLSNHMRTHIGDRRYKCKTCNKGFLHSGSLKEHIRGVHQHVRRIKKRKKAIVEEEDVEQKNIFKEEDYAEDSAEYLDLSMIV